MSEKNAGDFKNVDAVTEHVERLVDGWASVIRCKASQFGGPSCDHIIMIVFRDFYRPAPDESLEVWDSSQAMLCESCAVELRLLDA